jgi:hypothetical protein
MDADLGMVSGIILSAPRVIAALLLFVTTLGPGIWAGPLFHTFSIVARDPETGEMGVAVQSHWFSVGSIVTWGEAGVDVVATQSFVDPGYGPRGLELPFWHSVTLASIGREVEAGAALQGGVCQGTHLGGTADAAACRRLVPNDAALIARIRALAPRQ